MSPTARRLFLQAVTFSSLCTSSAQISCSQPPSWTVRDLNITTFDDVGSTGTAGFAFTYNLTNQTEPITCPLHSNYRCTIAGTRTDNSTVIDIQLGLGTLYVSVVQMLNCVDDGPTTFLGNSEMSVDCETVQFGTHVCTGAYAMLQGAADV